MTLKFSELGVLNEGTVLDGSETVFFNKGGLTYKGTLAELWAWKLNASGGQLTGPVTFVASTALVPSMNFKVGVLSSPTVANAFEYNGTNLYVVNYLGFRKTIRYIDDTVAVANGGTGSTTATAALTALGALPKANPTSTGKMTVAASVVGASGFNIPAGVDPTTLANGDIWTKTTGLYARINGVTYRYQESTVAPITALADAAATLTAAQLLNGVFTSTPTAARALTTDTAVAIIATLPGYVVGTHYNFTLVNNAAFDLTLTAGTGVTLIGKAVVNNASATWKIIVTAATTVSIIRT